MAQACTQRQEQGAGCNLLFTCGICFKARPAHETLIPESEISRLLVVVQELPVGFFRLPYGLLVGRLLSYGHTAKNETDHHGFYHQQTLPYRAGARNITVDASTTLKLRLSHSHDLRRIVQKYVLNSATSTSVANIRTIRLLISVTPWRAQS